MTDIKPRIDENGEPKCDEDCPAFVHGGMMDRCRARKLRCSHETLDSVTAEGEDCIPALRQQRDQARKDHVRERCGFLGDVSWEEVRNAQRKWAIDIYGPAVAARLFPEEVEK